MAKGEEIVFTEDLYEILEQGTIVPLQQDFFTDTETGEYRVRVKNLGKNNFNVIVGQHVFEIQIKKVGVIDEVRSARGF